MSDSAKAGGDAKDLDNNGITQVSRCPLNDTDWRTHTMLALPMMF